MSETARLILRPLCEGDRASFIAGIQNRELCRLYGFSENMDAARAEKIFEQFRHLSDAYAIVEKKNQIMVGFLLDVSPELPENMRFRMPESGRTFAYAIFTPYQRRGYMSEALEALISGAFQKNDVDFIHCGHFDYNSASEKLLQKLGFQVVGRHVFRDKMIVDEMLCR
jgi:ribosomal-protein-alanine N-acetyltransferase